MQLPSCLYIRQYAALLAKFTLFSMLMLLYSHSLDSLVYKGLDGRRALVADAPLLGLHNPPIS